MPTRLQTRGNSCSLRHQVLHRTHTTNQPATFAKRQLQSAQPKGPRTQVRHHLPPSPTCSTLPDPPAGTATEAHAQGRQVCAASAGCSPTAPAPKDRAGIGIPVGAQPISDACRARGGIVHFWMFQVALHGCGCAGRGARACAVCMHRRPRPATQRLALGKFASRGHLGGGSNTAGCSGHEAAHDKKCAGEIKSMS